MPKLTLKTKLSALIVTGAMVATPAFAQTSDDQTWEEPVTDMQVEVDHFALADVSADGQLDMDEFKSFVSSKADAGDLDAAAIRDSGEYASAFTQHDTDADGVLTAIEVSGSDSE